MERPLSEMTCYNNIVATTRSFMLAMPDMPESQPERFLKSRWRHWTPGVELLILQGSGSPMFFDFDTGISPGILKRTLKNPRIGPYCMAFHSLYCEALPVIQGQGFYVGNFDYDGSDILYLDLVCNRCHKTTSVDATWFKALRYEPEKLLCCHKRLAAKIYWELFFWALCFLSSLISIADSQGLRVHIVPSRTKRWNTRVGPRGEDPHRVFSQYFARERRNGVLCEMPNVRPYDDSPGIRP